MWHYPPAIWSYRAQHLQKSCYLVKFSRLVLCCVDKLLLMGSIRNLMHLCIKLKLNIQYLKVKPHANSIANTSITVSGKYIQTYTVRGKTIIDTL